MSNRIISIWLGVMTLFFLSSCKSSQSLDIDNAFNKAEKQTRLLLKEIANSETGQGNIFPRSIEKDGTLRLVKPKDWTSGFFPGTLWYLYENSGDAFWLQQAQQFTAKLESQKLDTQSHDTGFKVYCSFGNGYRLTNNEDYKDIIVQTAKSLSTRYNPVVGAIRSWDHNKDKWDFPVIIDNLMNLELLFAATRFSSDSTYYHIAVNHANTTLKNHFREDYSSFHVVGYNPETGAVEKRNTHQGYADESAWARGQAWALYGYTVSYRETKDNKYLEQADKVAHFIFSNPNLPNDMVPYWDFDAPDLQNQPRDVSAAAVIASALYELSTFSENGEAYKKNADKILSSLEAKYTSADGENRGFVLGHSTGNLNKDDEVDAPLNYADYYYLEAMLRKMYLKKGDLNK